MASGFLLGFPGTFAAGVLLLPPFKALHPGGAFYPSSTLKSSLRRQSTVKSEPFANPKKPDSVKRIPSSEPFANPNMTKTVKRPGHVQRTRAAEQTARTVYYLIRKPSPGVHYARETIAVTAALAQRGDVATGDVLAAALARRAPPISLDDAMRSHGVSRHVRAVAFISRAAARAAVMRGNPYADLCAALEGAHAVMCPLCGSAIAADVPAGEN